MTPLPIIRLDVEGMRFSMLTAISQYQIELDEQLQNAVKRVCDPDNVQKVLDREMFKVFEAQVALEVAAFFGSGEGKDIINKAVVAKLRKELKRK